MRTISQNQAKLPLFVGIDLDDGHATVGVVDDGGHPLSWLAVPAEFGRSPEDALRAMGGVLNESIRKASSKPSAIARVGLALPGIIDRDSGVLTDPANGAAGHSRWEGFPVRERFSAHCGLPTSFVNNAIAAAYGEAWIGAGRDLPSLVLLTLDTHVRCGVIFGDRSIDGHGNYGIAAGHMMVHCCDDAPVCSCGQRGHLEAYVGASAMATRAQKAVHNGRQSTLARWFDQRRSLTPELLAQEANAGDALSLEVIEETARYLGVGIVNIMNTLDPDGVLLAGAMTFGGNTTPLGRQFMQWVKEEVGRRAFAALVEHTLIDFASLAADAACLGAAGLARLDHTRTA